MATHRPLDTKTALESIPAEWGRKWHDAKLFEADERLIEAIGLARSLELPLLLTGDPGCGKTTAAYWAALRMGVPPERFIHAQIRSSSTAADIRYHFDAISYFRESTLAAHVPGATPPDRRAFLHERELWQAFQAAEQGPTVLLFDEIDKAPRDFPNDLLHEIEQREFEVRELMRPEGGFEHRKAPRVSDTAGLHLVVLTSNGERKLPRAFLRRCVHHHIPMTEEWLRKVVASHVADGRITLAADLRELALKSFLKVRGVEGLHHTPGIGECLVWLEMLSLTYPKAAETLAELLGDAPLAKLPLLGALLKDPDDLKKTHHR